MNKTHDRKRTVDVRWAPADSLLEVQLVLAAALLALLPGGAAFASWGNEQDHLARQRNVRNVEAGATLLGQAEEALKAGDAGKAAVALEAAKNRSAEGGADREAQRLKRLQADLTLVRDLDAIDQFRWTVIDNKLPDAPTVARRAMAALSRFGAGPEAVPADKAAARVSASAVRERIVSALDRLVAVQKSAAVRALLRRVDSDPYRDTVRDAILAGNRVKVAQLAGETAALEQPPGFVTFLGESPAIPVQRRRQLLAAAVRRRPGDLALLMALGSTYPLNQTEGANARVRWYQAALAAAPANVAAHVNLAGALHHKGEVDEAIAYYRQAIALDPKLAQAHTNLGNALQIKGKVEEAIAGYRKAIALDPKDAVAHYNLGNALRGKGKVDEAIGCYKKAIELDPKYANAHNGLGIALADKGKVDEAIACYRKAIALDPRFASAHLNLGNALKEKGRLDEAIACFRKAIELDPKHAYAHNGLGNALAGQGKVDEAIACYRKAIALDPRFASAHLNLGNALKDKGRLDEAIACFRKALQLQPNLTAAKKALAAALKQKDGQGSKP
jgi:tetratricopeptide (TPR) repeat protein